MPGLEKQPSGLIGSYLDRLPPARRRVYETLIDSVTGKTPLREITHLEVSNGNRIFLKLEYHNVGGVHHSRIYPSVFARAESMGLIAPGITPVIEASAGGAAIAFAHCANALGYRSPKPPQVVVPEYLSPLREQKLMELEAIIHKVPAGNGRDATVHHLEKILAQDKAEKGGRIGEDPHRLFCCTKIQKGMEEAYFSLAEESSMQVRSLEPGAAFDLFVACVGSGSSISGVGRRMKKLNPGLRVVAVEHELTPISQLLREGKTVSFKEQPHPFHGGGHWGVGPEKLNIDYEVIDGFECYDTDTACETQTRVNQADGLSVGLTTSAAVSTALKLARSQNNKNILVIAYDSYEQSRLPDPSRTRLARTQ